MQGDSRKILWTHPPHQQYSGSPSSPGRFIVSRETGGSSERANSGGQGGQLAGDQLFAWPV